MFYNNTAHKKKVTQKRSDYCFPNSETYFPNYTIDSSFQRFL